MWAEPPCWRYAIIGALMLDQASDRPEAGGHLTPWASVRQGTPGGLSCSFGRINKESMGAQGFWNLRCRLQVLYLSKPRPPRQKDRSAPVDNRLMTDYGSSSSPNESLRSQTPAAFVFLCFQHSACTRITGGVLAEWRGGEGPI